MMHLGTQDAWAGLDLEIECITRGMKSGGRSRVGCGVCLGQILKVGAGGVGKAAKLGKVVEPELDLEIVDDTWRTGPGRITLSGFYAWNCKWVDCLMIHVNLIRNCQAAF